MLIKELQDLQRQHGYRPREALHDLTERLNVLFFEVYGVASFYPHLRFEPPTSTTIRICTDLRCHLAGAQAVRATLQVACDRVGWPRLKARASRRMNRGSVFVPFHFKEATANVLTIDALDPYGKIPELKSCIVRVERLDYAETIPQLHRVSISSPFGRGLG